MILSATTVSCQLHWSVSQPLTCNYRGRISVEQTRSITEGLVAKLEEQAADGANGGNPEPEEEPGENGDGEDEEDEDEEDDSEDVRSVCTIME